MLNPCPLIGKILASLLPSWCGAMRSPTHQSRDPNSYFVLEFRDVATYNSAQGHRAPSVHTDLRALAAVTAIVAFELLTTYAEYTEQGMWPLLDRLEHSLLTILTSRFRIA